MLRHLLRIPRSISVTVAALAAAGLLIISVSHSRLSGLPLLITVILGMAFAALAIALPQLQQWQAAQLQVGVKIGIPQGGVPQYTSDQFLDDWLENQRQALLHSLERAQQPAPSRRFDATKVDEDDPSGTDADRPLKGVTIADMRRLQARQQAGEVLGDDEARIVAAFMNVVRNLAGSVADVMTDPDTRTPEQYRDEVRDFLAMCRTRLDQRLLWAYVANNAGRLVVTLTNPTDRVFENVQVEVLLPGAVTALDPEALPEPPEGLPRPPRLFGERRPKAAYEPWGDTLAPRLPSIPRATMPLVGPDIDNSASAKITFRPVTLRPHATETLDVLHLVIREPAATTIDGTWEATATNANGRARGTFQVIVSSTPLDVPGLLGDMI